MNWKSIIWHNRPMWISLFLVTSACAMSSLVATAATLTPDHYPRSNFVAAPEVYPPLSSAQDSRAWILTRAQFFTTADKPQQVAGWYRELGWISYGETVEGQVGRRWTTGTPDFFPVSVSHTAIVYTDYRRQVCRREATCIFTKSSLRINLPDLTSLYR